MTRRLKLDGAGNLVDRDGQVFGRLVGVTIDVAEGEGGTTGGERISPQQQSLTSDVAEGLGGGTGEGVPAPPDPIETVWAHYVAVMKPRNKVLDSQARAVIRDALKVATVVECCDAISGCKASAFHMGQNDRARKYNRLSQILKGKRGGRTTREQIDFFLDIAERAGARVGLQSAVTSADPAKISRCKQAVLDARAYPGDGLVVSRGEDAARWLRAEVGIEWDAAARRWRDVPREGA